MPYDIARALDNPNIIGNALAAGQLGRKAGQQNALARIASQAYTAPAGEQRNALVAQAVSVDPGAGFALGDQLAARDTSAASAQEAQLKKVGGAARYMMQAIKTGNPAAVQGAYQVVRPFLAQMGASMGKVPPEQYDPSMEAGIQQVIAATGGMPEQKGVVLSAGGQLRNPMTGELLADNPQSLQYHDVPMGAGKAAGVFDPSTGEVRPAVGGIQPAGDPMQPFIDQANQAVQLGADPAKVDQWLARQAQQAGIDISGGTMGAPVGGNQLQTTQAVLPAQFGVGTPRQAAGGTFTQLSPDEVAQLGLPAGTVAQRGENGKIDIVSKPSATDARLSMQARAAKGALSGSLQQLDRLKQAAMDLKNDPGLGGVTGYRGHIPDLPGSDAARARAQLDTLKSQIGFGVLQQMREMSKTGGALGSVSDRENTMLQNNLAALSTNQSAEDFAKSLDKIVSYVDDAKARMQGAYQDTYGDVTGGGQDNSRQPASGGIDDLLSKYGVH